MQSLVHDLRETYGPPVLDSHCRFVHDWLCTLRGLRSGEQESALALLVLQASDRRYRKPNAYAAVQHVKEEVAP